MKLFKSFKFWGFVVISIGLTIGLSIGNFIDASIYNDNFDEYATGTLNGNGNWTNYTDTNSPLITNELFISASNSIRFDTTGFGTKINISTSTYLQISFKYYKTTPGTGGFLCLNTVCDINIGISTTSWANEEIIITNNGTLISITKNIDGDINYTTTTAFDITSIAFWKPTTYSGNDYIDNFNIFYDSVGCLTNTTIYDCLNEPPVGYCVWNYINSTCEYPEEATTTCSLANTENCTTEADCLALATSTDAGGHIWKPYWRDPNSLLCNWNIYDNCGCDLRSSSIWQEWATSSNYSTTSQGIIDDFKQDFMKEFGIDPENYIKDKINMLNPVNNAPYSWIYQGIAIFADEINNQSHSTTSSDFSSSTNFCFAQLPNMGEQWSSSTNIACVQMFPVDELKTGGLETFFTWGRNIITGLLALGFFFYIFKRGSKWLNQHATNS